MKEKFYMIFLSHRYTVRKMPMVFTGASVAVGEDMFLTTWWRNLKIHQVRLNQVGGDLHKARDGETFMRACL